MLNALGRVKPCSPWYDAAGAKPQQTGQSGLGRTDHDPPQKPGPTRIAGEAGAWLFTGRIGRETPADEAEAEKFALAGWQGPRPASGDRKT